MQAQPNVRREPAATVLKSAMWHLEAAQADLEAYMLRRDPTVPVEAISELLGGFRSLLDDERLTWTQREAPLRRIK